MKTSCRCVYKLDNKDNFAEHNCLYYERNICFYKMLHVSTQKVIIRRKYMKIMISTLNCLFYESDLFLTSLSTTIILLHKNQTHLNNIMQTFYVYIYNCLISTTCVSQHIYIYIYNCLISTTCVSQHIYIIVLLVRHVCHSIYI
jgi:hypothetical protein